LAGEPTFSDPKTLLEATRHFSDPDVATRAFIARRWPNGIVCPKCESTEKFCYISTRRILMCKACRKQFSPKVGTIFEDSPLGLDKWMIAAWLITNAKNGISSHELSRALGISQHSTWFMLQRIRLAMQTGTFEKAAGQVEVDETYIGGKARFMRKHVRERKITGTGGKDKTAVMGILERTGRVRTKIVSGTKRKVLQDIVRHHVEPGAEVFTDALKSYEGLNPEYLHQVVDHAVEYVKGHVHTNGLENFWSLLKRTLKGTYVSVEPFHLFRYLDEQTFRYNERKDEHGDSGRFRKVAVSCIGRRVTYKELTGKSESIT
jgi:transposase-like protein